LNRWQTVRAWASVHATGPALGVFAAVASASLLLAQLEIEDFGLVRLVSPVAIPLLLPAIAGVGTAIACENTARLGLPDPVRAVIARAAWAMCWVGLSFAAAGAALIVNPEISLMAIARNLMIFVTMGLLMLSLGLPHLLWLPVLGYVIGCIMFGYDRAAHEYRWWAVVMEEPATAGQLLLAAVLATVSISVYAVSPKSLAARLRLAERGR
jgi:hypothetical protein